MSFSFPKTCLFPFEQKNFSAPTRHQLFVSFLIWGNVFCFFDFGFQLISWIYQVDGWGPIYNFLSRLRISVVAVNLPQTSRFLFFRVSLFVLTSIGIDFVYSSQLFFYWFHDRRNTCRHTEKKRARKWHWTHRFERVCRKENRRCAVKWGKKSIRKNQLRMVVWSSSICFLY